MDWLDNPCILQRSEQVKQHQILQNEDFISVAAIVPAWARKQCMIMIRERIRYAELFKGGVTTYAAFGRYKAQRYREVLSLAGNSGVVWGFSNLGAESTEVGKCTKQTDTHQAQPCPESLRARQCASTRSQMVCWVVYINRSLSK